MKSEVQLKTNYSCPACGSYLRIWNNIIFTVKSPDGKKKGILLLNPELGNYSITAHSSLHLEEGEKVDFFCPVCHTNLAASNVNENLVRINMSDENDNHFDVYFSRILGEESTFKIKENNIIAKFGKDDSHYVNYFISRFREQEKEEKPRILNLFFRNGARQVDRYVLINYLLKVCCWLP